MEYLVYAKDHWYDVNDGYAKVLAAVTADPTRTLAEQEKSRTVLAAKYEGRYRRGDIVEAREDGYWTAKRKGFGAPTFALLVGPEVKMQSSTTYRARYHVATLPADLSKPGSILASQVLDKEAAHG